jgi:hypothetical protein
MTRFEYQQFGAKALAVRGNRLPHARLNPEAVRQIRANVRGRTARQLADEFGVHFRTIEKVRSFETWGHIA